MGKLRGQEVNNSLRLQEVPEINRIHWAPPLARTSHLEVESDLTDAGVSPAPGEARTMGAA